jgi:hypothetical protein
MVIYRVRFPARTEYFPNLREARASRHRHFGDRSPLSSRPERIVVPRTKRELVPWLNAEVDPCN